MKRRSPDDAASRRLRANGNPDELDRILQDECRRRAANKLAATLLSAPGFRFPTALSAEQCTSDTLADIHAEMICPGESVADLTCGLAIDAFHIASRASKVVAVDIDPALAAAVEPNARALGLKNVTAVNADCRRWLAGCNEKFDTVFIDPARRGENGRRLFSPSECTPDVTKLLPLIGSVARRLIVKLSPMLDISRIVDELPGTARIHVLGTTSECKELVAEIIFGFSGEPEIIARTAGRPPLTFRRSQCATPARFAENIAPGMSIGEPWPAIMKADPRGLIDGLQLHPSTRLWTDVNADFPGKRYEVTRVEEFSSSNLRRLTREKIEASVAARNFPLSADELRKRLRASESSTARLMATTMFPNRRILIFMRNF